MEEAPVAGESPDRSKQHESSAEPTSGSKAPVPDPRLAVAREAVTAAARVDTATAVFSTKRSAGSAGSEGSAAGSSQGSDGSADRESAGKGPAKGAEGGDARLRDVVAAWVATADDEAPEGASGADGSGDAEVSGDADGADGPESDTSGSDGSVGSAGGDAEVPGGAEGAAGGGDSDDEGESGAGSGSAEAEPDDSETDEDAEPEGAAAEEAPAADDAPADADSAAETDGDDVGSNEAKDQPEAGADAKADAAPEAVGSDESEGEGSADGDVDAKADAVPEADAASGVDEPADEVSGETKADAVPEADAVSGAGESADEVPGGAKADAVPAADAVARAGEPADEALGEGGADADAKAASGSDTDQSDAVAVGDGDAGSDAGSDDDPKPPVDQPTAIFKMPKRAVDQPTTMLKWGGAKPGAAEADEKPGTEADSGADSGTDKGTATDPGKGAEPGKSAEPGKGADRAAEGKPAPAWAAKSSAPSAEPESERTSKFVALKPLDEPAPPKARPLAPPSVPPAAETAAIPQVGPERTTQQPLPPKPPLDLLAELTNTPAPRQTPVRTIVRRVKIWTPLVLLLAVVFAVVQAVRPLPTPTLALTADESYAFEGNKVSLPWPGEGQGWMDVNGIGTVDKFGEQKPVAIGSVAKAMTAYVILKEHPLKPGEDGAKIPVDAKAETEGGYDAQNESTLNTVKEGDVLTEKDALAAIMIPSANNIARLLARWDTGGSEEEFVEKMNAAAKDLGMTNTTYTDPSGLKETTVSTAEDQVKLGNQLVRIQALVDITKLPTWVDPSGKKWDNYNRLVPYNNAIGIKTGSTTKAGGNLLFAATQEVGGENVIVVGAVLGQHKPPIIDTVNAVSKEAMIAAQEALTSRKILKKGDVVGYVDDGLGGRTPVVATKDVSAVGWAGQTVKLKLGEDGTAIPHEAKAGTKVGSLSVGDGTSGNAVEVPVALQSDLVEPGYGSKLTRVS
ncbi:D-alanyl-D-alanine carboxypeptidase (penicillin-binding protein 5/6) [Streptomyces umbrinus]|uniref:D-alanyl-D-alanine carboxypeptidase (Penicillin-binding protein 5/6) n=1 Tax=Streptomyces umbrinus TaxID=67370 RepID=A0ABU0SU75_9ACTN|nr:D-alanyl-D-alanine carboxypeptidase [Streptomyces umbrinus]MDQ1027085.1 D-alanyl-D-alanine carboxypeptidase (penicillin-binding protein 5/6) [Streptomyces umbrinus]